MFTNLILEQEIILTAMFSQIALFELKSSIPTSFLGPFISEFLPAFSSARQLAEYL